MRLVSKSPEDTQQIAAELAARILDALPGKSKATIITLRGDLGAGKTTFTQGFARALKIPARPKSPTFMLAKQYSIPDTPYSLWHLDCYRLESHEDLVTLDLHSVFNDARNIVLIEWPERVSDGLPQERIEVHFSHERGDKRGITISE